MSPKCPVLYLVGRETLLNVNVNIVSDYVISQALYKVDGDRENAEVTC